MQPLVLGIDFNNLMYGSYYGDKYLNSRNENVNAIRSFFTRLRDLKNALNPDHIIIANDLSRDKTFRRRIYAKYKANRKTEVDPDIQNQMSWALQILALMGYPIINNIEYEADDILGMVSKYATNNKLDMIIVSADRDLYQLINDTTYIYSIRNKELIDKDYLFNKYRLKPEQWIEMKIIVGDNGDNIPGRLS